MIKITNLSEGQEDCFLVQIFRSNLPEVNVLVDGGKSGKRCKDKLDNCDFEELDYAILTHIDDDHIQGLLKIFGNQDKKYRDTVIIYNRFVNGMISYKRAEKFEKIIGKREVLVSYKEYQDNHGSIVFLSISQRQKLERKKDEIYITFLAPSKEPVEKAYNAYQYYKKNNRLISDNAEIVNRSSIMFLLEYQDSAILMLGDGYISDIISNINSLSNEKDTYMPIKKINLIKLPHHGSEKNNAELQSLLKQISCEKFILTNSDNGNVQITENLKNELQGKKVYSANLCEKYTGLIIANEKEINIGD